MVNLLGDVSLAFEAGAHDQCYGGIAVLGLTGAIAGAASKTEPGRSTGGRPLRTDKTPPTTEG
jgi:hypothetical protein